MSNTAESDLKKVPLSELADSSDGSFVDGPFGSNLKTTDFVEKGVRVIQLQNIGDGFWKDENQKFITLQKLQELDRHKAQPGDIAIAKMADPVARACIVPDNNKQYVIVADCIRLRVNQDKFDPRYVVRAINHSSTRREAENKAIGSTRVRINLSVLKTVSCVVPPLRQQSAIADILDTLDTQIRQAEAIIAKLKQVKQGLLHDLLTRGIDANGLLRPRHDQAPELYKESPLGWIPREWEVRNLGQLTSLITSGSRGWASYYSDTGSLFLRSQNVRMGSLDLSERQCVNPPTDGEGLRTRVEALDLLVTITGNGVGNLAYLPDGWSETAFVSQHVALVRFVNPWLAKLANHYLVLGGPGRQQIVDAQYGQSKPGLNLESLRNIRIPAPSGAESEEIIARIALLNKRVEDEVLLAGQLHSVKSGLMDDLLTGRVRVTSLLDTAKAS